MSGVDNQTSAGTTTDPDQTDVKTGSERTFTQEDLGKKLSTERSKLREQFEKEKLDALNAAKLEWEKQAKMTEEERATEAQKVKEEAIAERERQVTLRERQVEATAKLTEKNLPVTFVDYVVNEDAEKMTQNIESLAKVWSDELKKAVKTAVSGSAPEDKSKGDIGKKTATKSGVYHGEGSSVI